MYTKLMRDNNSGFKALVSTLFLIAKETEQCFFINEISSTASIQMLWIGAGHRN